MSEYLHRDFESKSDDTLEQIVLVAPPDLSLENRASKVFMRNINDAIQWIVLKAKKRKYSALWHRDETFSISDRAINPSSITDRSFPEYGTRFCSNS